MASIRTKRFAILAGTTGVNLSAGTIKVGLLIGGTISGLGIDADVEYVSAITAYEAVDGSYGRQTLGSKVYAWDAVNNRAEFSFANPSFGALNGAVPTVAFFMKDNGGADSANDLLGLIDLPAATPDGVNPYVLTVGSEGALWV